MSQIINPKINRAERPDKTMFFAMMGVIFILFSLPAFYWAFYNYGQYSQTTAFVQDLQKKSDTDFTPTERQERSERISLSSSRANRYLLEMALSGAGGLILFGIALILFRSALKARKIKPHYENIDWRVIPMPTSRIEVRQKLIYDVLFAFVVIFFGGIFLLVLLTNGIRNVSVILSVSILAFLAVFCFLMFRAKRQRVRLFDASGITRGDGRQFSWNEFCGVVTRIDINHARQKYVWRIELAFANHEAAWLIPNRIENAEEVFNYVVALPRAYLKNQA